VKGSANLYRAAISESGLSSPGTSSSYYNMGNALDYSNSIVQQLNCTSVDKESVLSCLRNSSIEDLLNVYGGRYTRPIIDNYFFPLYPPLAIQNGRYNNISLIMGNNDYEQPICFQHPDLNFTVAVTLVSESVGEKWLPSIVNYYHLNNCSSDVDANISRCCNIVRLILMDKIFDCDIRRIFNAFYSRYGPEYENNKLFSYHLDCNPQCPVSSNNGVCEHTSELPYVFGTVSDVNSKGPVNCTWDNQTREFSNRIISHWISIAVSGRPLSSWSSYDPSTPKYFQITPDQDFQSVTWNRNCSFFDEIEAERVREIFGNNNFV
jgi:carboxylesterase type B